MERKREYKPRSTRKLPVDGKMQCTKCKEWKELAMFSPNANRACGVASNCKQCGAEYSRLAYRKNPSKGIERSREWHKRRPEKAREYLDKYADVKRETQRKRYRLHRAKCLATKAVNAAIASGRLDRQPCSVCGNPKADGHHWSYLPHNWLSVIWLCRSHHLKEHSRLRKLGIEIAVPGNEYELTATSE